MSDFKLTRHQKDFLLMPYREAGMLCPGAGGGKTWAICYGAWKCANEDGRAIVIVANHYSLTNPGGLIDVFKSILKALGKEADFSFTHKTNTFTNVDQRGGTVRFTTWEDYAGESTADDKEHQFQFIGMDNGDQITPWYPFRALRRQLRDLSYMMALFRVTFTSPPVWYTGACIIIGWIDADKLTDEGLKQLEDLAA